MTQRHYNPMEDRTARRDEYKGDDYEFIEVEVNEIREKSFFIRAPKLGSDSWISVGRSLLHAKSDDRLENYKGELPQKFVLSIRGWWIAKYKRDHA